MNYINEPAVSRYYHDHLSASVFVDDQDPRLVQDIGIEDLLGVIDETRRRVVARG